MESKRCQLINKLRQAVVVKSEQNGTPAVKSACISTIESCAPDPKATNVSLHDVLEKLQSLLETYEQEKVMHESRTRSLRKRNDELLNIVRMVLQTHEQDKAMHRAQMLEKLSYSEEKRKLLAQLSSIEKSVQICLEEMKINDKDIRNLRCDLQDLDKRLCGVETSRSWPADSWDVADDEKASWYRPDEGCTSKSSSPSRFDRDSKPEIITSYKNSGICIYNAAEDGLPAQARALHQRFILPTPQKTPNTGQLMVSQVMVGQVDYNYPFKHYLDRRLIGHLTFYTEQGENGPVAFLDDCINHNWVGIELFKSLQQEDLVEKTFKCSCSEFIWWSKCRKVVGNMKATISVFVFHPIRRRFVKFYIPVIVMDSQIWQKSSDCAIFWTRAKLRNSLFLGKIWIEKHRPVIDTVTADDRAVICVNERNQAVVPGKFIEVIDYIPTSKFGDYPAYNMKIKQFPKTN